MYLTKSQKSARGGSIAFLECPAYSASLYVALASSGRELRKCVFPAESAAHAQSVQEIPVPAKFQTSARGGSIDCFECAEHNAALYVAIASRGRELHTFVISR